MGSRKKTHPGLFSGPTPLVECNGVMMLLRPGSKAARAAINDKMPSTELQSLKLVSQHSSGEKS
jgi:hypothetical protein